MYKIKNLKKTEFKINYRYCQLFINILLPDSLCLEFSLWKKKMLFKPMFKLSKKQQQTKVFQFPGRRVLIALKVFFFQKERVLYFLISMKRVIQRVFFHWGTKVLQVFAVSLMILIWCTQVWAEIRRQNVGFRDRNKVKFFNQT